MQKSKALLILFQNLFVLIVDFIFSELVQVCVCVCGKEQYLDVETFILKKLLKKRRC